MTVKRGSRISSTEYRREKEGIAIRISSRAGMIVQTISSVDAWIRRSTGVVEVALLWVKRRIRTKSLYLTKQRMAERKILRSSWKAIIPSAIGAAGV